LVVICLLTFQLQALAASALPCRHALDPTAFSDLATVPLAARVCAHALTASAPVNKLANVEPSRPSLADSVAGEQSSAKAIAPDCQKCALDLCVFGAMAGLPQPPMIDAVAASRPMPSPQSHFYLYSDDLWSKPPIPGLS
jgi:hypothetical protein